MNPAKWRFIREREMKTFLEGKKPEKQKLREFVANKIALQELLKELFREKEYHIGEKRIYINEELQRMSEG